MKRTFALDSAGQTATVRPRLDQQLCFQLYAGSRLVTRLYQPLLEPQGLTYPQYIVMMILWERAPCSISEICTRALLNTNTLSPLLKRLERLGYIQRAHAHDDERVVHISLTPAGSALEIDCSCVPERLAEALGYPKEKAIQLKTLLDGLVDAFRAMQ
jgi:MarR family transcriptional regulator, organic hydroperoxide resistance regulator